MAEGSTTPTQRWTARNRAAKWIQRSWR